MMGPIFKAEAEALLVFFKLVAPTAVSKAVRLSSLQYLCEFEYQKSNLFAVLENIQPSQPI